MKTILGLDLGTNSIGWAVINSTIEEEVKKVWISLVGSRIIPMDAAILGDFDKGNSISQTAERTRFRGVRRLRERQLLRRESPYFLFLFEIGGALFTLGLDVPSQNPHTL